MVSLTASCGTHAACELNLCNVVLCCVLLCCAVVCHQAAVADPGRWTSLKQRLREVKRGRQNCSSSRASSTIADSSDGSSVVSEGSSVVEVKLERLLLQVATKPRAAGCTSAEKRPAPSCPSRGLGVTVRR